MMNPWSARLRNRRIDRIRPSAMTPNVGGSDGAPCGGRAAQRAWILLVDGHVHSHECFTWKTFLDAAAASFARARAALALNHQSPGCPMFTESAGMNQFRRVAEHPDGARLAGWRVQWHDGNALTFSQGTCEAIVLVAGRQLRIHSPLAQQHGAPGGNQVTAS